jgi:hypothetical protein
MWLSLNLSRDERKSPMWTLILVISAVMVAEHLKASEANRIRQALRCADISLEKAASYMELDKSLLRRQLDGEGHLSHTRLLLLPETFWQWYHLLGSAERGMPAVFRDLSPLRMIKMALRQRERVA